MELGDALVHWVKGRSAADSDQATVQLLQKVTIGRQPAWQWLPEAISGVMEQGQQPTEEKIWGTVPKVVQSRTLGNVPNPQGHRGKKKKKANFSPWTQCHNNMGTSRSSRLQGLGHTGACKRRLLKWMPSKIPFHWDAWATVFCCWTFGPRSLGKSDRWFSPNLQSTLTPGHRWLAKVGLRTEDLHY